MRQKYCQHIDGFNRSFTTDDLSYFRIQPDGDFREYSPLTRFKHEQALFALSEEGQNYLCFYSWGARPDWWKNHKRYNANAIYFVNVNKLSNDQYFNSKFVIAPVKAIVLREASNFNLLKPEQARHFWLLGISWSDRLGYKSIAFIKNANGWLIEVPESRIRTYYREQRFNKNYRELIREVLNNLLPIETLNRVQPIDKRYAGLYR